MSMTYFTTSPSICIVDVEQVNVIWGDVDSLVPMSTKRSHILKGTLMQI